MIERLIDNWLDKANERLLEAPFRFLLAAQGYTVLHQTRHWTMEIGKDIVAIRSDGTVCAYQLKGTDSGRLTMSKWQAIAQQVWILATSRPTHPSLPQDFDYEPYLVVNGDIEEDVQTAIQQMNDSFETTGHKRVRTIVRGQLQTDLKHFGDIMWPTTELAFKTFLELLLNDGKGTLPKGRLATILESVLPLDDEQTTDSAIAVSRSLAGAALLCAIAINNFVREKNHVAVIEAWTMYAAYVQATATRRKLARKDWNEEYEIARHAIHENLHGLRNELENRSEPYFEGETLAEMFVYRARMTQVVALMSVLEIWQMKDNVSDRDAFLCEFVRTNQSSLWLWGEAAVPQIMAIAWADAQKGGGLGFKSLVLNMATLIASNNRPQSESQLPSPYYDFEKIAGILLKLESDSILPVERFSNSSWTLDGLFQLLVRDNWKQLCKSMWPSVSRVAYKEYRPAHIWQFMRWNNGDEGVVHSSFRAPRIEWGDLMRESVQSECDVLPGPMINDPVIALLFVMVYPHRFNRDIIRWLDWEFRHSRWID